MRDLFYTILVVWIIWRIVSSINSYKSKQANNAPQNHQREGETTVDYIPPVKKRISDDEGEYVDYEEMK